MPGAPFVRPPEAAPAQRTTWLRRTRSRTCATVWILVFIGPAVMPHPIVGQMTHSRSADSVDQRSLLVSSPAFARSGAPRQGAGPAPGRTAQRSRDRWFAADKLRHLLASYGATMLGFGTAHLAGFESDAALPLAIAASAAAGIGKEILDGRRGGPFSLRDLLYDAAGIAVAAALLHNTQ